MITDALGHTFAPLLPRSRIVSLVPSLTETLFELGVGASVAGVTSFCIFPEAVRSLPKVGGTKSPRIDHIRELKPDLVHLNLEENVREHAELIATFSPVFASEPGNVDHVVSLIHSLGELHRAEKSAARMLTKLETARASLQQQKVSFSFACAIWKEPWMWCGGDTYVSSLIGEAGGRNIFAGEKRYPTADLESIVAAAPDVVFLPDEPFAFSEADAEALRAQGLRVTGPFPGHLVTWHGSRTIEGLHFLESYLQGAR